MFLETKTDRKRNTNNKYHSTQNFGNCSVNSNNNFILTIPTKYKALSMEVPVPAYPGPGAEDSGGTVTEHAVGGVGDDGNGGGGGGGAFMLPFPKQSNDSIVGELGGLSLDSLHIEDIESSQPAPYKNQIFRSNSAESSLAADVGARAYAESEASSLNVVPQLAVNRPRQGNRLGGFAKWAEAKRAKVYPDIPEDFLEAQDRPEDLQRRADSVEDALFGEDLDINGDLPEPNRYQVRI